MEHQVRIPELDSSASHGKTGRDREARALYDPLSQPTAVPSPRLSRGPTITEAGASRVPLPQLRPRREQGIPTLNRGPGDTLSPWVPRPHRASHGPAQAHQGPPGPTAP